MTQFDSTDNWLRPSPKLWTMRLAETVAVTAIIAVLVGLPLLVSGHTQNAALAVVVIALAGIVGSWFVWRRVNAWSYCEREEELLIKRGLMVRRLSVVPYGRMQFVDVTAGLAERIFKLATVQLHTAAAATDAKIPGLSEQEAHRLRDQLTVKGESKASGL